MSKKSKERKVKIQDAYDEISGRMSDEEAHRGAVYKVPSIYRQTATCFMIQMKRYTKHKMIWFLLLLILAIPVAVFVINMKNPTLFSGYTINENMSAILIALPLLGILIPCIMCGKILPQEFNERTVYLSLPLPMSRNAFYYGKFLAGFVISVGLIVAAYGAAMFSCKFIIGNEVAFSIPILLSMAVMVCATFFFCSFVYMRSARSRRGSTLLPFILLFILVPILAYAVLIVGDLICGTLNVEYPKELLGTVLGYVPSFSDDLALANLGSGVPIFSVMLGSIGSYGIVEMTGINLSMGMTLGSNIIISCGVNLILGLLCLHRGSRKVARRDM